MLVYLLLLSPLWGSSLLIYFFVSRADWSSGLLGLTILSCAAAAWWFSRITVHYMVDGRQSFGIAFQNTFYPVAAKLAFLPVVGGFFARIIEGKKPSPFRDEPE
jgi:hypothetical protein